MKSGSAIPICEKCADPSVQWLSSLFGVIIVSAAVTAIIIVALKNDPRKRVGKQAVYVAVMKILLSHLQQTGLVASYELKWPSAMEGLFAVFDVVSSVGDNVLSLQCAVGSSKPVGGYPVYGRLFLVMLVPLILLAMAVLVAALRSRKASQQYLMERASQIA